MAIVGLGGIWVGRLIGAGREEALAALCDCRKGT